MSAHVASRPVLCGVLGIPWGIQWGVKSLICMARAVCAVSKDTGAGGRVNALAQNLKGTCICKTHIGTAHTARTAHSLCIKHLRVSPYPTTYTTHHTNKKMDGNATRRVIRCTSENVSEMRDLVSRWPELNTLVRDLQAQNLFPGLRALQITLSGPEQWVSKGLGAVMAENAPEAAKGEDC